MKKLVVVKLKVWLVKCIHNIIFKVTVSNNINTEQKNDVDATETAFNCHKMSFKLNRYTNNAILCKYIWTQK